MLYQKQKSFKPNLKSHQLTLHSYMVKERRRKEKVPISPENTAFTRNKQKNALKAKDKNIHTP